MPGERLGTKQMQRRECDSRAKSSLAAQSKATKTKNTSSTPQSQKWTCPPAGILKANCDGSFFPETKKGGWGFIFRDHKEELSWRV